MEGFGFRVSGFGFRVWSLGFRVSGLESRVSGFGFRLARRLCDRLHDHMDRGVVAAGREKAVAVVTDERHRDVEGHERMRREEDIENARNLDG